jgi:hypothetical protein
MLKLPRRHCIRWFLPVGTTSSSAGN